VVQTMKNTQIMNVNSELVLDITDDGTSVTQRKPGSGAGQRWDITIVDEHDNLCLIENAQNGKVLAPDGEWKVVFQPKGGAGQQWRLAPLGGCVYFIENPYSKDDRVLDIDGSSKDEKALIAQYKKNIGATANQQWEMITSPARS